MQVFIKQNKYYVALQTQQVLSFLRPLVPNSSKYENKIIRLAHFVKIYVHLVIIKAAKKSQQSKLLRLWSTVYGSCSAILLLQCTGMAA